MAKQRVDHTYLGANGIVCKHCGVIQAIQMPIAIKGLAKLVDAFNVLHADCKKP